MDQCKQSLRRGCSYLIITKHHAIKQRYFQIIRDVTGPMNKIIPERVVTKKQKIRFKIEQHSMVLFLKILCRRTFH
jgi:hypothetical protein